MASKPRPRRRDHRADQRDQPPRPRRRGDRQRASLSSSPSPTPAPFRIWPLADYDKPILAIELGLASPFSSHGLPRQRLPPSAQCNSRAHPPAWPLSREFQFSRRSGSSPSSKVSIPTTPACRACSGPSIRPMGRYTDAAVVHDSPLLVSARARHRSHRHRTSPSRCRLSRNHDRPRHPWLPPSHPPPGRAHRWLGHMEQTRQEISAQEN